MNNTIKESNNLYKVFSLFLIIVVVLVSGCCFSGSSYVVAKMNGRMIDNSGNPIENEKVITFTFHHEKEERQELLTDKEGIFSCHIANTGHGFCCIIPPIGCIPPVREPYFIISVPNISPNKYLIKFPWGAFKCKKMGKSVSSQNIKRISEEELKISGVLNEDECTSYSHDWIIDLEIRVKRNHEEIKK